MSSPNTLDNRLILACARTDPNVRRIENLVERGPDWQGVLRKAERWGLTPLVYASLRQASGAGQAPKAVTERLRQLYHRDTIHGMAQRALLRATLPRFSEAGVAVVVLKGAALAALVYPSPDLRPIRGIDLLVRGHDLDRADEALRELRDALGSPAVSVAGSRLNPRHAIPYLGPESFSLLRVRQHIAGPGGSAGRPAAAARIPIEDFWERARPVQIESTATLVLSHEDLLLHLALDLADRLSESDGSVGGVRTLCDIGETCRRYGDAIDWGRLVRQARVYDVGKELYSSLRLAHELVGAPVASRALKGLRASLGQPPLEDRRLVALARRSVLSEGPTSSPPEVPAPGASPARGGSRPRPRAQGRGTVDTPGDVAVTYDQSATDGVGAQLLRMYGLYALSRALRTKYVHSPLGRVGYQGLLPLLTGRTDPDFAARYNAFFTLPSDDFDLKGCERVRVHYLDENGVEQYRAHATTTGRPVLLRAHEPYGYLGRHPASYLALRAVSPYRGYRAAGPIRVCIHLRRGDHRAQQVRCLPNAYYLRACGAVVDALRQQGAPFVVRLHTEVPPRRYTLHPGISGLYFRLDEPATIDPADDALEDFEALPNLEMVLNVEPREALDDFATADVLILSPSDFSYLGGLLNPHGLVIATPRYHPPLPDWLVAGEHGDLDPTQVATRIAAHVRYRYGT